MSELELLSIISAVTFIACEGLGIYIYKLDKQSILNKLFFCSSQSLAIWSLGLLYIYQTKDVPGYWLGDKTSSIGWISFHAIYLHMNLVLTENRKFINKKWKVALIYLPAAAFLYWEQVLLGPLASAAQVGAFYSSFTVFYLLYDCATLLLVARWGMKNKSQRKKMQAKVVFFTTLIALIIGFTIEQHYQLIVAGGRAEPAHPVILILLAGYLYALRKYSLFNLSALIKSDVIISRITEMVMVVDPDGMLLKVNPRFEELTGYCCGEVVGSKISRFFSEFSDAMYSDEQTASDTVIYTKWGEGIPLQMHTACIYDQVGDLAGIVLMCQDMRVVNQLKLEIEARKRKEAELEYNIFHDSLTGMYNRAFFEQELQRLGQTANTSVAIIIGDVDGLKFANDTFGHGEGDKLLLAAANILQQITEGKGKIARIGGDEFAILMIDYDEVFIKRIEEKLRIVLKEYNNSLPQVPLSISIGIATSRQAETDIVELFKRADNNMYRVKLSQGQSARSTMVQALLHTLGARDVETEDHAERLRELALELGEKAGMCQCDLAELSLLAQFHDLGKVGIPDRILLKPGPLNEEEWQEMKRHPEIGRRIAQSVPELIPIARLIFLHHERWDGKGYPLGLSSEQIPLECRILAIVDAYDAMTNDRPYRVAVPHTEAMEELLRCAGTQFDPKLVMLFVEMMKKNS